MVLRNAFNAYDGFACAQPIATTPDWEKLGEDFIDRGEAQPFIDRKPEENKNIGVLCGRRGISLRGRGRKADTPGCH